MKNNWKELEEEELMNLTFDDEKVKSRIGSTMDLFKLITNIIELYIPNVLETVVNSLGSDKNQNEE